MQGYEAALKIANLGVKKLILGTRTTAKGETTKAKILAQSTLEESAIETFEIEHGSFASVSRFADTVKASTSTLDCVLLSAGVAMPGYEVSAEGWEMGIQVNVLSSALLAIELLPLLRAAQSTSKQTSCLEFVSSVGYCNVTPAHIAPLVSDPSANVLQYFNDAKRYSVEKGYFEAKLLVMFVEQGIVESLGGTQGKSGSPGDPIVLSCCPGQCKTDLGRNFSLAMKALMSVFQLFCARTAEQGSRVLVTGLQQGEEAHGRMWMNDRFDDRSPALPRDQWENLQKRAWKEVLEALRKYKPDLEV
jgi:NAD(P)-dependent dehydrogenase (short-subunit alcohol dehydrogenase family)